MPTLDYIVGYRPPPISEGRVLAVGMLVFMLSVLNEHLVQAYLLPWRGYTEPYGFFVLICCLGYVAARRFFETEQRLTAIEQEMETARRIQSSILPRSMPVMRGLDVAVAIFPWQQSPETSTISSRRMTRTLAFWSPTFPDMGSRQL